MSSWGKLTVKLLSVACVFILLMTSFQVMTTNVMAESAEEEMVNGDAQVHDHRQLTVSNEGATDPTAVVADDGTLHLAWANVVASGEQLFSKSSKDAGTTFSSDRQISPTFSSISNITIDCWGDIVAVAFEACSAVQGVPSTYLLVSFNQGNSWSQIYGVSEGSSPTVGLNEDGMFLGMTRPSDGKEYFVIVKFSISSNQLENGTSIFALETGEGFGRIIVDENSIDYAIYCRTPNDAIVYGSITLEGGVLIAPSLIIGFNSGSVDSLDLAKNGITMVVWSWNGDGMSFIGCSSFLEAPTPFGYEVLYQSTNPLGKLSVAPHSADFSVAWANDSTMVSTISYLEVLRNGSSVGNVKQVSTSGVVAGIPTLFADVNGTVSCVWIERHLQTTELFYFKDVARDRPDINQLREWIRELDDLAFVGGMKVKEELCSSLTDIIDNVSKAREDVAIFHIDTLLYQLDDLIGWRAPYDQGASDKIKEKVDSTLKMLKKDVDPDGTLSYDAVMLLEGGISFIHSPTVAMTAETATITWTTSISGTSVVQYGLTPTYGNTATGSNGTAHSVTLTGLTPNTEYRYRVTSASTVDPEDSITSTEQHFRTSQFAISGVVNTPVVHTAQLTWDTTGAATTMVEYGLTTSYGSTAIGENGTSHSVSLTGLSANTLYRYRMTSARLSNPLNVVTTTGSFTTLSFTITNKHADDPGAYSVVITWDTPETATSIVQYGLTTAYGNTVTGANGTSHSVTIYGLSASTLYHYKVSSASFFNPPDSATSTDGTFTTGTPISISNIQVNSITTTSAMVTWTTSRASTSEVEYGATTSYGNTVTDTNGTTHHTVILTGLTSGSTIHYRIRSASVNDPSDQALSSDRSFTTVSISISGYRVDIEGCDSVLVTWSTNCPGTTVVDYYVSEDKGQFPYGSTSGTAIGANGTTHSVLLTGLAPDAQYRINLTSVSLTNPLDVDRHNGISFTTQQFNINNRMAAPSIYGAVITWTSNGEATSVVEYGLTTAYGSVATGDNGTWHSVELSGLNSGTRYYYRVHSNYLPNTNVTASATGYFYTSSFSINGLTVTYVDFTSAVITWTTSCTATSTVEYGLTAAYGANATGASGTTHSVTITGLMPMVTYHFRAMSVPDIDSTGVTYSTDRTFLTTAISNVQVSSISITSAIVTWTTSLDCTSEVRYGLSSAYGTTVNGATGTSHSILLTGLDPATLYHFQVWSTSVMNASRAGYSSDNTFTTRGHNDAGQNVDAGASTAAALLIVTGSFTGDLDAVYDASDYYKLYCFAGQTITTTLAVPTGYNFDLALLNPSGAAVATSTNGVGVSESVSYVATATGYWYIKLYATSGSGGASYTCGLYVTGGMDDLDVDVGAANDMSAGSHLPGIYLLSSSGWFSALDSMRQGPANATFVLSLYEDSYQSSTGYLITVRYYATSDTVVQVLNNGVWVDVATLPGKTATWSYSFVLKPEDQNDSLPDMGRNVQLRFAHALKVDYINAIAYSYITEFGSPTAYHNPGVVLENGWTLNGAIANGTSGATLIVSIPRTDIAYSLAFTYFNSTDGMQVQQYTSSGYQSIGTMQRWGSTAFVQMNRNIYYDADPNAAGMNVRIKILSPLYNLSSVRMTPTILYTDVGVAGDNVSSSKNLGISIYANTEWSGLTTVDGKTVRTTLNNQANFYLNAPVSGQSIRIDMYYKTSNTGAIRQWNGLSYTSIATLTADGAWHYVSAWVNADDYFDYAAGSKINALFEITAASTSVDHFYAYIDSDDDTLRDSYEISQGTDPLSKDTDSDGLNDNIEPSYGTSPIDADCDDDGLLDGSERWSQSWSTDEFVKINGGSGGYISNPIYLSLPAINNVPGQALTAAWIHIGLMHAQTNQVKVVIWKNGDSYGTTLVNRNVSGSSLFISRNLFTLSYDANDFRTASSWTLFIDDYSSSGGQLQYFKIQVDGKTNPLVADSDGDGILDGEEVNMGTDGWVTNPMLVDTDSDGVSDRNEIIGSTPCGQKLDPTYADSDGDGHSDGVDPYLGDMVLHLRFDLFKALEDINWGSSHNIYFYVSYGDMRLATARFNAVTNVLEYPDLDYYLNVYDTNASQAFSIQCVADEAGTLGDDIQLDGVAGSALDYSFTYTFSSESYSASTQGSNDLFDGDADVYYHFSVEKITNPTRARTIVINSTDESSGLYVASDGSYRYCADEQVYLLYITVSGTSTHFVPGVNVIIVPRFLALESQLNNTLTTNPSSTELSGASFYTTDATKATASGHVVAVIEKTMTSSQAETLLTRLTHDSTNARIANNVTISTSNLYLLHLPSDISSRIPYTLNSDALGEAPDYLSIGGVIGFIVDMIITIGTSLYNLAANLIQAGINFVCNLWSAVTTMIAVIVDAFNAFVAWAIELISSTINAIFSPIVNAITGVVEGYTQRVAASLSKAINDYENTGTVSSDTQTQFGQAIRGDLFWILVGITTVINLALMILSVVTNVFGFLLGMIVGLIVGAIVEQALNAPPATGASTAMTHGSASENGIDLEQFENELNNSGVDTDSTNWGTIWGVFGCLSSVFASLVSLGAYYDAVGGKTDLVLGTIALILSICSIPLPSLLSLCISGVSLVMGVFSLFSSWGDYTEATPSARVSALLTLIVSGIAAIVSIIGIGLSIKYMVDHPEA